jgi:hypothetical protein
MLVVERPTKKAGDVFLICISRVRNKALKARLLSITNAIANASIEFENAALHTSLHRIARHAIVGGTVTQKEMAAVYTNRMVQNTAPGRFIYDELISASPHGRCPLCGQRYVSTLDHHLPKAHYPSLAVAPLNLIPSCGECNKAKLDITPLHAVDEMLHPYFDDIDQQRWLRGTVLETQPAVVHFSVVPPAGWSNLLSIRVKRHFATLGLGRLYGTEAATEILNIRLQMQNLHIATGANGVQEELAQRAASCRAVRQNSWQTAAYEAFAGSNWFCDGGFSDMDE